ncbi:MAG: hypothetical protein KGH54_04010 [Candidatus Micrarchaeota archaeon]|nr:hypothetical protein [Candidatus Micrarchaeota archaeon]
MATNPDELLIFKLRGMGKKAGKPQVQEAKPIFVQKPVPAAAQKPIPAQKPAETPKAEAKGEEAKRPVLGGLFSAPAPEKQAVQKMAREEIEQQMVESVFKKQAFGNETMPSGLDISRKKGGRTEAESREAAKGLTCINHPWRPAYGVCDYCSRPFCYADLVEYDNRFYDLEHIDNVAGKAPKTKKPANSFIKIASALFVVNSILLFYSIMPQLSFIINYLGSIGPSSILGTFDSAYGIPLFNLTISIFGLLAGILVILTEERGIFLSGLVGTLILVGASFEYLNSYLPYLLVVSLVALASIIFLAYGRVSATTTSYATDIVAPDIDWPRIETF